MDYRSRVENIVKEVFNKYGKNIPSVAAAQKVIDSIGNPHTLENAIKGGRGTSRLPVDDPLEREEIFKWIRDAYLELLYNDLVRNAGKFINHENCRPLVIEE